MKIQVKEEKAPSHSTNTVPKDKTLSADDATLFQAVLRVVDDGCSHQRPWLLWSNDPAQEDVVNQERMEFADAVVATFKRFRTEDDEERLARR